MRKFTSNIHLHPCTSGLRGITWIELYILYRINNHPKPICNPSNSALCKPTLAQQLGVFKCKIRSIIKKTIDEPAMIKAFMPDQQHAPQFVDLAIEGHHPALAFDLHISVAVQQIVATQLIRLTRKFSKQVIACFLSQEKGFRPAKIDIKGKAPWDDHIPLCSTGDRLLSRVTSVRQTSANMENDTLHIPLTKVVCPNCQSVGKAVQDKFLVKSFETHITCARCGKQTPSRDWKCQCNIRWHI